MKKITRILGIIVLIGLVLFALIQLVPYGRSHKNPPVVQEPNWDAQTRAIAKKACFDCHSNEVVWPWYSNIAPVSWLVQRDVDEGRRHLNFSEWGSKGLSVGEIAEVLRHRSQNTTAIYSQVSFETLRTVAQPWPANGGVQ